MRSPLANRTENKGKVTRDRTPALVRIVTAIVVTVNFSPSVQIVTRNAVALCCSAKKQDCSPTFEDETNSVRGDPPTGRDG